MRVESEAKEALTTTYFYKLVIMNVILTFLVWIMDAVINDSENSCLVTLTIGGFGILCLISIFLILKSRYKDFYTVKIVHAHIGTINLYGSFFATLSLPAVLSLKQTSAFYILIGLTILLWCYQYAATNQKLVVDWDEVFRSRLKKDVSEAKTNNEYRQLVDGRLQSDADVLVAPWFEKIKAVLIVVLVLSMIAGLNLRKVYPTLAPLMWAVPMLVASSICANILTTMLVRIKLIRELEKEFPVARNKR